MTSTQSPESTLNVGCGHQQAGVGGGLQWVEGVLPLLLPSSVRWTVSGVACARLCLASPLCCAHALQRDRGPASGPTPCLLYDDVSAYPLQPNASYVTYLRGI